MPGGQGVTHVLPLQTVPGLHTHTPEALRTMAAAGHGLGTGGGWIMGGGCTGGGGYVHVALKLSRICAPSPTKAASPQACMSEGGFPNFCPSILQLAAAALDWSSSALRQSMTNFWPARASQFSPCWRFNCKGGYERANVVAASFRLRRMSSTSLLNLSRTGLQILLMRSLV